MVDLVGIEPTTCSVTCSEKGSRTFVFKTLTTATLGRERAHLAMFPAKH